MYRALVLLPPELLHLVLVVCQDLAERSQVPLASMSQVLLVSRHRVLVNRVLMNRVLKV